MKDEGWLIIAGAIGASIWYVKKRTRPRVMTQEELEFIAPAPFSDQGRDNLAPSDNSDFTVTGAIGLTRNAPATGSRFPMMGIWAPNYARPVPEEYTPPEEEWNTPMNPAGNGGQWVPGNNGGHNGGSGLPLKPVALRLGSANIKNYPDMPRANVEADARKIASLVTIWGGQEIEPGEDTPVILKAMGKDWAVLFQERETPIFYRADLWEPYNEYQRYLERGTIKLVTKTSAVTSSAFRSKKFKHKPFSVVNWHGIPGAFHRHAGKGGLIKERQPVWRSEFGERQHVAQWQESKGHSTFFLGDDNHDACPMVIQGGRWICAYRIDRIGYHRNAHGGEFRATGNPRGSIVPLKSDHPLLFVSGTVR